MVTVDDIYGPFGLGNRAEATAWYRLGRVIAEPRDGSGANMSSPSEALSDHIAVTNHGDGIGSDALGNFIECFADYAKSRVLSTGRLQYEGEGGEQRFEALSSDQLYDELIDELADALAYVSMLAVKALAAKKKARV